MIELKLKSWKYFLRPKCLVDKRLGSKSVESWLSPIRFPNITPLYAKEFSQYLVYLAPKAAH